MYDEAAGAVEKRAFPGGTVVATGQTLPIVNGKSQRPFVCVWDSLSCRELRRIALDASDRDVTAASFSPDGRRLATMAADDYRTVYLWDWRRRSPRCLFSGRAANANIGMAWNLANGDSTTFCTYGTRALRVWGRDDECAQPRPNLRLPTHPQALFAAGPLSLLAPPHPSPPPSPLAARRRRRGEGEAEGRP